MHFLRWMLRIGVRDDGVTGQAPARWTWTTLPSPFSQF